MQTLILINTFPPCDIHSAIPDFLGGLPFFIQQGWKMCQRHVHSEALLSCYSSMMQLTRANGLLLK